MVAPDRPPLITDLREALFPVNRRWKPVTRVGLELPFSIDVKKTVMERAWRKGASLSGESSFLIGLALHSGHTIPQVGGWYGWTRDPTSIVIPGDYMKIIRWMANRIMPVHHRSWPSIWHAGYAALTYGLELVCDNPELDFTMVEIESGARREQIGASYLSVVRRLNREMNEIVEKVDREVGFL